MITTTDEQTQPELIGTFKEMDDLRNENTELHKKIICNNTKMQRLENGLNKKLSVLEEIVSLEDAMKIVNDLNLFWRHMKKEIHLTCQKSSILRDNKNPLAWLSAVNTIQLTEPELILFEESAEQFVCAVYLAIHCNSGEGNIRALAHANNQVIYIADENQKVGL